jgi:hypothetical protein
MRMYQTSSSIISFFSLIIRSEIITSLNYQQKNGENLS